LGGTPLIDLLSEHYFEDENVVVAGTSAGAMVMSKIMISEGGTNEALLKDLITTSGFGFLEHCIVDIHFIKRGRFGRLAQPVILNPMELVKGCRFNLKTMMLANPAINPRKKRRKDK